MDDAAPAAGAAVEKKRRLLHRIPTSLVVTLLGIALTGWLLPAVSRQWDGRQRANELKAQIDLQIAAATAHALIGSRQLVRRWNDPASDPRTARRNLRDDWLSD